MVDRVSTSGRLLNDLMVMQNSQQSLELLQYRVSTGKKFQQLKLYGNDAPRIVDLRNEISTRQAYMRSMDLTEGITGSYDAVLDRLAEAASEILDISSPIDAEDPAFLTDTTVLAENLMLEIESNLNVRIGDRYIFAGTNYGTAPVNDLRDLALYNETDIGTANTSETADTIPEFTVDAGGAATVQSYHSSWAGSPTTDEAAWRKTTLTIDDRQTVSYGITATDPAFQKLIDAVVRLKSAVADPGPADANGDGETVDERKSMLGQARSAAEEARIALRQLQSENGAIINQFDKMRTEHENFIAISQGSLEDIEGANKEEAAVQISTLQAQLQASYTTIARRAQLSLVNFLG